MAHSYWKFDFFMGRYITKVQFYALQVKFEQVSRFLLSPRKKFKTMSPRKIRFKENKEWLKTFGPIFLLQTP
jgi:hypothetical protein